MSLEWYTVKKNSEELNQMRLLLIGLGGSAISCFNQLPEDEDWVKAFFLNYKPEITVIQADRKFNYGEGIGMGWLDGGIS